MTKDEAQAMGARCLQCPLLKDGVIVPSSPASSGKVRLAIVGEVPGRLDERLGSPLNGLPGKVLDDALRTNGLKRSEAWVGNAALCRGDSDKENERAAECCAPRLLQELSHLPHGAPVLTLGKLPTKAVLGVRSILVARGFIWTAPEIPSATVKAAAKAALRAKDGPRKDAAMLRGETLATRASLSGRRVLPTIHPSFVLRADTWNAVFQLDSARASRAVLGTLPQPLEDVATHRVGGLEVLDGLGDTVSLDTETDGIDTRTCKMLCVGLSDGKSTAVIWPWRARYAKPLSRWLRSRAVVVAHNGLFDIPVLRNHGVK